MDKTSKKYFWKWLVLAPIGFSLVGFGLCLMIEIAHFKHQGGAFWIWFGAGTLSLVIVNAGLAFVGDAVKNRVFYEWSRKSPASRP